MLHIQGIISTSLILNVCPEFSLMHYWPLQCIVDPCTFSSQAHLHNDYEAIVRCLQAFPFLSMKGMALILPKATCEN